MKIVFLGKIKFYGDVVDVVKIELNKLVDKYDFSKYCVDFVFVWNSEEGEIFWDLYDDLIKIGIPLENRYSRGVVKEKFEKAINHWLKIKNKS